MPSILSLLCVLLIFFTFNTTILAEAQANKSEIDRQALLCFKSGISSEPLGILRSWSSHSFNFCSWHGVTCSAKLPYRVASLDLASAQLSGQISGCIANLTSLSRINLTDNYLSGAIPEELGKLPDLQTLMLAGNNLEGNIPYSLGSSMSLSFVNLANNTLSGGIPHSLANSYSLNTIILSRNNLSEEIPATLFANSSALTMVDLQMNSLTGPIPPFGKVTGLKFLCITENFLSGSIPEELGKLPDLQTLMLAGNNLEGNIPYSLGSSMSLSFVNLANNTLSGGIPHSLANSYSLNTIILSRNNLSGEIPDTLFANSSALTMVDLQMNSFTGPIPPFGKVTGLKFLCITENFLSGSIPPSIGNVSSLTSILLGQNNLTGLIPESLSHIPKLLKLDLSFNSLSGHVPISVYNMSSLKYFSIGSNGLIGQIPSYIGYSLPNLQFLIMQSNKLEGLIPSSLANTSNLQVLDLSNNSLRGPVPSLGSLANLDQLLLGRNWLEAHDWAFLTSLANCTQLITLSLEGNTLDGSLPRSAGNLSTNLQGLLLGANQISGSIPSTLGKLDNLFILDLSKNKLSGQIPSSIGNISQLGKLYLGDNNLSGNIPSSLGRCLGLLQLNLSANNLDGFIPEELFAGPPLSLGVDLSHNNLTGAIPSEVGLRANIALLNISNNMLFGVIPEALGNCLSLSFLLMEGNKLQGQIPSSLKSLQSLQQMNLSRNNLSGLVPEFFEAFTMLVQLDLSYNNFEGPIPTGGIFQNSSAVTLDGNIRLCARTTFIFKFPMCPTTSAVKSKKNARLLLIVIPPITIALFSFLSWMVTLLKTTHAQTTPCYKEMMKRVSYGDILKATNWFSPVNKISSSRTGSVYIGRFEFDTDLVAIKLFHLDEHGAHNSFLTECEVLRNTRHRNLVKAVTVCSTVDLENNEFKAIVFEFMANGSLDMWVHPKLHQNSPKRGLSLGQRIRIAMDVASALDYMHNQLTPPLIHCDLKPSNVLLDYDMTARVGDFGSAKFLSSSPDGLVAVGGTIGYIAPEYGMGYKISTGCDVYSFGVLLLEMLTGKRPTDEMFTDGLSLHKLVCSAFPDRLQEVIDPNMPHEEHHACATVLMQNYVVPLVEVGLLCSMESPKDRPGMGDVCAEIFAIKNAFPESW